MAIFDAMFEFSDAQVITDSDAVSSKVIDFTQADLEMGAGVPVWLNIRIGDSFVSGGGSSIDFALYYHTTAAVGSGTSLWSSGAIAVANLGAGQWIVRQALPINVDEEQFVGCYYDVTGTSTAGTINAWLDHGPQSSYGTQVTTSNI